uniref:Trafficking protein particle complex subunit 10 n=1 Tax=Aceria tosichella TaxID=561515 RepID=A0A6G1SKM0_9ACAR
MTKTFEKPIVTVSGKKSLFKSSLHKKLILDLSQEGVEWRRRLDSGSKSVYIDVDFVDFDIDNVERSSERLSRLSMEGLNVEKIAPTCKPSNEQIDIDPVGSDKQASTPIGDVQSEHDRSLIEQQQPMQSKDGTEYHDITIDQDLKNATDDVQDQLAVQPGERCMSPNSQMEQKQEQQLRRQCDITNAFFNQKLLGRPILHTYWADKSDFEAENQKSQFDEWIGQVQASTCTEWAIIIIEDGDFKAHLGTALFKSKLQSSASQTSVSSSSISSMSQSSSSFLDRMKKGLSTMFQNDSNSDRWLTLVNQERVSDNKAQESYANFVKKFRNLIIASFSKQLELFEEQLRVQREMRAGKNWSFSSYFSMQEELAFAFEFLTLFDEALVQYDFLDALFTDYISSLGLEDIRDPLHEQWTKFNSWPGLCLDMSCEHSESLRKRIVNRQASLLDFRNYLFAKRCDLMFMQNQPWRVAAATIAFLQNCLREHELLKIDVQPGALTCWSFISALEVLQKCECYSCTSTMENYSFYTVDIWNNARRKLIDLGALCHLMPGGVFKQEDEELVEKLIEGLGPDPHNGLSYQKNDISPHARLKDALLGVEQYTKHLIEISELTLGTYKHIGRKRHALLVGMELAELYAARGEFTRALPFLADMEKILVAENWTILLSDVRKKILNCSLKLSEHESGEPEEEIVNTQNEGVPV